MALITNTPRPQKPERVFNHTEVAEILGYALSALVEQIGRHDALGRPPIKISGVALSQNDVRLLNEGLSVALEESNVVGKVYDSQYRHEENE